MPQRGNPDVDPPAAAGIEQIYADIRSRLGSGTGGEVAPSTAAPGIAVVPLRTPTLPPATHTGCYLVGDRALVAIDPASPWPDEQDRLLAALPAGAHVALIALTHHHGDHVGAATALAARTGAPIAAHPATAARLAGRVAVTRALADGEVIATDGERLRVLHTPGHAPGHLVFQAEGSGAVIAGDLVAGLGTILIDPGPGEGHMATYLASLERLLALGVGALLPAHGPVIADGPAKLREYLAHRRMREERVAAALTAAPQPSADLVAVAYADTPPALAPIAERSLLAHLVKLAEDGRARAVGDRWQRA
ncbi:MAG: MBL fold metallo-hydrolase [Myxococcales bacterium]|nr:MBL fold metallo-hydrolase [Myxococcales bacterium]MBK7197067.1 MBL fold metallo-hydrolase [Myxococcales bacterium]MBP6846240.1 MBL fold metallo-hydrolase [Kofleriaceae bacterium]